jgi:cytochrome d ubiquinol oxidase subunit I
MWHGEPAPAGFSLFALPDQETRSNSLELKVPYALGIIATRSLTTPLPGILDLVETAKARIRAGMVAYEALQVIRAHPDNGEARATFNANWRDLGYALLLKRYRDDVENATAEEIDRAAADTIPDVAPLFWSFRVMVGLGFYFIAFFAVAFWLATTHRLERGRLLLTIALVSLPLPWIAIEAGWIVAEYGRQPWIIEGVLPTFYAASGLTLWDLAISLGAFLAIYTVLAIVDVWLMTRSIKAGPSTRPLAFDAPDMPPQPALPGA